MGALDKVFGLVLIVAGIFIAVYWTVWQVLSLVSTPKIGDKFMLFARINILSMSWNSPSWIRSIRFMSSSWSLTTCSKSQLWPWCWVSFSSTNSSTEPIRKSLRRKQEKMLRLLKPRRASELRFEMYFRVILKLKHIQLRLLFIWPNHTK